MTISNRTNQNANDIADIQDKHGFTVGQVEALILAEQAKRSPSPMAQQGYQAIREVLIKSSDAELAYLATIFT